MIGAHLREVGRFTVKYAAFRPDTPSRKTQRGNPLPFRRHRHLPLSFRDNLPRWSRSRRDARRVDDFTSVHEYRCHLGLVSSTLDRLNRFIFTSRRFAYKSTVISSANINFFCTDLHTPLHRPLSSSISDGKKPEACRNSRIAFATSIWP